MLALNYYCALVFFSFPGLLQLSFTDNDFLFIGLNYTLHQKNLYLYSAFSCTYFWLERNPVVQLGPDPEKHMSTWFIYMNSTIVQDAGCFPILAISLFPCYCLFVPLYCMWFLCFFQDFPVNSKPGRVYVYDHVCIWSCSEWRGVGSQMNWDMKYTCNMFKMRCQNVLSIAFHLNQLTCIRATAGYCACSTWTLGGSFW